MKISQKRVPKGIFTKEGLSGNANLPKMNSLREVSVGDFPKEGFPRRIFAENTKHMQPTISLKI